MAKIRTKPTFKEYTQNQPTFLPLSLDELIAPGHLVRVVDKVVEKMDISSLLNLYLGGGTSSYHPRMLLKVLLYAYSSKIYTGRKIARALNQDIHFMWLSGKSHPDFRTINSFRSSKAKEVIEDLFKEMLLFLMEHQYIKMENYFNDGSTFAADANRHKMVWKKNAERFKQATESKCLELFEQIDELNQSEDKQYGKQDLEENGAKATITPEAIEKQVERLNQKIKTATDKQTERKAKTLKKELEKEAVKLTKYDRQIDTAGSRGGYSKTDEDATGMRMKNDELLPAYNIMAGCEEQFITGVSVHQNTNDGTCLIPHLKSIETQQPQQPKNIIADSIFGTEQNYQHLEDNEIGNYMKFPQYHNEQTKKHKENIFHKGNFPYNPDTDSYTCPNNQQLTLQREYLQENERTGFKSTLKEYACGDCSQCPLYAQCCKSETGGNRTITINLNLERHKQKARENLKSKDGEVLRKKRSIEIESCFGDIKHNMGFRRFHLRGKDKVKTEITIVAMAHNIRKLQIIGQKAAA